jgi:ABC-type dipeptide/oligopeptide/nickel transport system permease component
MFRSAVRQLLWTGPKLFATSLFLFFVTTLAPEPRPGVAGAAEARRARFADLPSFVNLHPSDIRTRSLEALGHIAEHDEYSATAARELCRLGGAALPVVLPRLESLAPEPRGRVATALAPVAERMGLASAGSLNLPESAALFWTRFWGYRALDFTPNSAFLAVGRLVDYGSDLRERDVAVLDTFALPALMRAMGSPMGSDALARATRLAQHATLRGTVVDATMSDDQVRRAVADWREWWFVHQSDFSSVEGAERVRAMMVETQYGRWLTRIAQGELGVSSIDGEPIAQKLLARAPVTLLLCAAASLLACLLAVPVGVFRAWRSGRAEEAVVAGVTFVLFVMPTFTMAEILRRAAGPTASSGARTVLAIVAVGMSSAAALSLWQRAALLEVLPRDFMRTAHAKGLSPTRVACMHALRNALLPIISLAGLEIPSLLGGAFVAEHIFGLQGLGFETMRAVAAHDTAWLMAVMIASSVIVTVGLSVGDFAHSLLDPRVRDPVADREGFAR